MILHVCTKQEWAACESVGYYQPSQFKNDGFIHCCSQEQLAGVLSRYFKGKENLLLISINEDKLDSELRMEIGSTNELFPHVYGTINKSAIVSVQRIPKSEKPPQV